MKFSELNPHLSSLKDYIEIVFDCPKCRDRQIRIIANYDSGKSWKLIGDTQNPNSISLTPSINNAGHWVKQDKFVECNWHGHITNGDVLTCG